MSSVEFYTVSELTRMIRNTIEAEESFQNIWVKGEISNFHHHTRGHMYFTLKDAQSRIKSVMFAGANRFLKFKPEDGMTVLARGSVSIYERDGSYQLYVEDMQPDGIGSLFLAFEQLKKKLLAEGLFSLEAKRPLPAYPNAIGIITSPTGAAIRDILTTIRRRYPVVHILILPVAVQGEEAVPSIVEAIEVFNQRDDVDLLIVGRGGGSIEELWAFNEEAVARSIYRSKIPVISAVGHETDTTIADYVADVRAATPTAAAELAVPNLSELLRHIEHLQSRLQHVLQQQLTIAYSRLDKLSSSRIFLQPGQVVEREEQRLDHLLDRLTYSLERIMVKHKERHQSLSHRLSKQHPENRYKEVFLAFQYSQARFKRTFSSVLDPYRHHYRLLIKQLDALSPLKVMQRGYAVVKESGKVVDSAEKVELGDIVEVELKDGSLDCQVYGIQPRGGGVPEDEQNEREPKHPRGKDQRTGTVAI